MTPWFDFVQQIMKLTQLTHLDLSNFNNFADLFKVKLQQSYLNKWQKTLNKQENNKLDTYNSFKKDYKYEQYLDSVKNKKFRIAMTKYRISAHKLPIESGRYKGINRDNRICKLCNTNDLGDEKHYMFHCSHESFTEHREMFFKALFTYAPNLQGLSNDELFRLIFSSIDFFVLSNLARFLFYILEIF